MAKKSRNSRKALFIGGGAAVMLLALTSTYLFEAGRIESTAKGPSVLLEPGWAFYGKPTSLEPPGTIFRIDGAGRRYVSDYLSVPVVTGTEVSGRTRQTIRTTAKALSRILEKQFDATARQDGTRFETLDFEMLDVQRELTTDAGITKALDEFRTKVEYKRDNRYFIIREARSAKTLRYTLSERLVNALGGSSSIFAFVKMHAGISYEAQGTYVLTQDLPERLRVIFLAEEIMPVSSGFAGEKPRFGALPIKEPLVWE